MSKHRKMPSHIEILKYWAPRLCKFEQPLGDDPEELISMKWFCFACALPHKSFKPERAHIRARWRGGSDHVSNIHLLCRFCHRMSENLDGLAYWAWFKFWNFFKAAEARSRQGCLLFDSAAVTTATTQFE